MAMKTILVPIPDTAGQTAAIEIALMVAKAVAGHVEALYIETPAPITVRTGRLGGYEATRDVGLSPAAQLTQQEFARAAEARERAAEQARAEFQRICAAHGVPVCAPDASDPVPSASWRRTEGSYASAVTMRAPAYDVMVVPNPSTTTPAREIAEHTLLETGRPVLLSPARPERDPSSSAMIAWFPSLQAWRAVAAAVPLMATARQVEIVTVGEDETAVAQSRADVIRYLGWHGITATARRVKAPSRNIGDMLLHEASEAGIGMLVMGAYSHSRVRELLLGGVTRHVLSNVAVTPVFMAH
jgi:nucleotide-binding universal stress UspA family protein